MIFPRLNWTSGLILWFTIYMQRYIAASIGKQVSKLPRLNRTPSLILGSRFIETKGAMSTLQALNQTFVLIILVQNILFF